MNKLENKIKKYRNLVTEFSEKIASKHIDDFDNLVRFFFNSRLDFDIISHMTYKTLKIMKTEGNLGNINLDMSEEDFELEIKFKRQVIFKNNQCDLKFELFEDVNTIDFLKTLLCVIEEENNKLIVDIKNLND